MSNKEQNTSQVALNFQYVKDLSFENPHAPLSLTKVSQQPNIDFSIDINVQKFEDDNYEVTLSVTAKATDKAEDKYIIFITELKYSGLFTIKEADESKIKEILLVHCPNLLFPFARRIIADVTRDGGFPPLMMQPVNFSQLYLDKQHK
jgi:preprotein translocase subunit SecB